MSRMTPYPIVFDLDGTLIDSAPDIQAAVNDVLATQGVEPLSLTQIRSFIGGGVELLWQRVLRATELDPALYDELLALFMKGYETATGLTRIYPGVPEALQLLGGRGHPLGVCTNKPLVPAQAVLSDMDLAAHFNQVIGGDSLPWKKPHTAPLDAAFAGLGCAPGAARGVYVGDSEFDASCAAALQVPFLLVTQGYCLKPIAELPHHASFDDWSQLPGLIETIRL